MYFKNSTLLFKIFFLLIVPVHSFEQVPKFTWKNGGSKRDDIQISSYGVKGVSSETNLPGPRSRGKTWTDSNGNFWLYGGLGNSFVEPSPLNDLWKYNIASGQWVWMHGSKDANTWYKGGIDTAIYGTKKISSPLNTQEIEFTPSAGLTLMIIFGFMEELLILVLLGV